MPKYEKCGSQMAKLSGFSMAEFSALDDGSSWHRVRMTLAERDVWTVMPKSCLMVVPDGWSV